MIWILLAHLVLGVAAITAGSKLGTRAFLLTALAPLSAVIWSITQIGAVRDEREVRSTIEWAPELGVSIALQLDGFGLLMVALVSGVGFLVFLYAFRYFTSRSTSPARLAGLLVLFSGSMLGLVLADNLLWLYLCWELTSITSYLLIGHEDRDPVARASALRALLITGMGGLAMLGGFVFLGVTTQTWSVSGLVDAKPTGALVTTGAVLVLLGAFTKSAQVPFHSWLPGAMVASTPISAYLHSAAMVKAGVFLVMRLGPAFDGVPLWRGLAVGFGVATMLVGGLRALRQHDLKLLLAFGTVSQLGFMMTLAGLGHPEAVVAGCALLLAHAAFKASLFMVVGIIDHQTHTRDLRRLGGFGRDWRPLIAVAVISAASMAGIAPLAGFVAKEAALDAADHGGSLGMFALVGITAGSILTVAYSARFVWGAFVRKPGAADHTNAAVGAPAAGWAISFPPALLAVVSVVLGAWTGAFDGFVARAALALDPAVASHLALWHGVTLPLVLSVGAIAAGLLMFAARRRVDALQAAARPRWTAAGGYERAVGLLTTTSARVTRVAQPGSLPIYAAVILLTAVAAPGVALVALGVWPGWPRWTTTTAHLPIAVLLLGGGVAAVSAKRRFTAAIFLGAVGYGMTLLFVVQGAPDLALTQFAIETLTVVLFLLVLRFLPDRFEHRADGLSRSLRIAVSAAVGVFVLAVIVIASAARTAPSVSDEMVERSLPDGGGRNVVNVILVDFRGFDTLGEITVLLVAAVGAVSLARVGRPRPRDPAPGRAGRWWARPQRRLRDTGDDPFARPRETSS